MLLFKRVMQYCNAK